MSQDFVRVQTKRKVLGNNIRRFRQDLGLSQERLAQLASLDRTYVGGIERGQRNASVDNIERISIALGIDASELLIER
jgi:transcriptional regulator with XRE-family HTH domain